LNSEPTTPLQGTLHSLILKSLDPGEIGLGVSRRIQQIPGGTFVVKPDSLFPLYTGWKKRCWKASFWGDCLAKEGRRQLEVETKRWYRISWAIAQALEAW
jgi:hypothetical protein